jgi:hypothetical protein
VLPWVLPWVKRSGWPSARSLDATTVTMQVPGHDALTTTSPTPDRTVVPHNDGSACTVEQIKCVSATPAHPYVGDAVGDGDEGASVGDVVGVALGAPLGDVVGSAVGTADGDRLGTDVGDELGVAVGAPDGDTVGVPVGAPVGAVGESVGTADGCKVGACVHASQCPGQVWVMTLARGPMLQALSAVNDAHPSGSAG